MQVILGGFETGKGEHDPEAWDTIILSLPCGKSGSTVPSAGIGATPRCPWLPCTFGEECGLAVLPSHPGALRLDRKARGTRDLIANICWIMEKAREFQKNIYFCFIDYAKAFDCVDHDKLWKILKEMGIPDHLTCLLRNLERALLAGGFGSLHTPGP